MANERKAARWRRYTARYFAANALTAGSPPPGQLTVCALDVHDVVGHLRPGVRAVERRAMVRRDAGDLVTLQDAGMSGQPDAEAGGDALKLVQLP